MISPIDKGVCLREVRERIGFDTVQGWARELVKNAEGVSLDAARKSIKRWEDGICSPSEESLGALSLAIRAQGFRRGRGGPVRSLIDRDLERAETVEEWEEMFDLVRDEVKPAELPRENLVRTLGKSLLECYGPGAFVMANDVVLSVFILERGEVRAFSVGRGVSICELQDHPQSGSVSKMHRDLRRFNG